MEQVPKVPDGGVRVGTLLGAATAKPTTRRSDWLRITGPSVRLTFINLQPDNRKLSISTDWGCVQLAEVRVQEGESIENALRRFKRKVQQEDIIKEVKRHSFYLKPGEKKRIKQALARKRSRKKVRRRPERD